MSGTKHDLTYIWHLTKNGESVAGDENAPQDMIDRIMALNLPIDMKTSRWITLVKLCMDREIEVGTHKLETNDGSGHFRLTLAYGAGTLVWC